MQNSAWGGNESVDLQVQWSEAFVATPQRVQMCAASENACL
jgi:hypothetical protein